MTRNKGKPLAIANPEASSEIDTLRLDGEPALDRAIQARIGDQLRAMYDQLLEQPIPDRFRELLGRLNERTGEES